MIHRFNPKTMELPYVQEINQYQELAHRIEEPLVLCEWDIEYAPETGQRFLDYIRKEPGMIHAAPYLVNIYHTVDGQPILFWAHRIVREQEEVKTYTVEEKFDKITHTARLKLRYPAWVAGGEPETDIFCLGFTYLPYDWWTRVYPEMKEIPWNVLDIEVSARAMRDGLKAKVHWDCVVNHQHIDIRDHEKSLFRKWVRIDKTLLTKEEQELLLKSPLTDEQRKLVMAGKLPKYHGFLGEAMLADKETKGKS